MPDWEDGPQGPGEGKAASPEVSGHPDIAGLATGPGQIQMDRLRDILKRVVKADVVPRLLLAEKSALIQSGAGCGPSNGCKPSRADLQEFQVIVLHRDTYECFEFLNQLRDRGVSLPDLYLGLFTPLARDLGQQWENDELNFVEVTKALGRMQSLVHTFSQSADPHPLDAAHKIVLASSPEEQHSLGMLIVSKLFEMQGWDVAGGSGLSTGQSLNDLVHGEWFGVVGLTASSEERALRLKQAIDELREASCNKAICVLVGGHGFDDHPEISEDIGADELVTDASEAVETAERLISRRNWPGDDRV